jgi:hypothetical protein
LWTRRYWSHGRLAKHHRFVARNANRLAASLFGAMARYGPKLDRQQVLLARFMDIGTELFVMSTTCAYAEAIAGQGKHARVLADVSCRQSRQRIRQLFNGTPGRDRKRANALAGAVLDGGYRWLEEGIVESPAAESRPGDMFERCA